MPISPSNGFDAPAGADSKCPTCGRPASGATIRHRGRLLSFAAAVGRYATGREGASVPPRQSDGPRLSAESSNENAGDGHPVGASAAAPGGLWSGGGLADWESRDILTLVVVILGIALIATAHPSVPT